MRAGGQDGDAAGWPGDHAVQGVAEAAEEAGEPMDIHLAIDVRQCARGGDAVLQRKAGAGRRLGAVAQHPPFAVGPAAELEGAEMQEMPAGRLHADQRSQELRAGGDQARRQQAVGDQAVFAVDVGDDRLEQFGALHQPGGDRLPFALIDQQRYMSKRPGALGGTNLVVDAVIDAGIAQILIGAGKAARQLLRPQCVERIDQRFPDGAHGAFGVDHLVGDAAERAVASGQRDLALRLARPPLCPRVHQIITS